MKKWIVLAALLTAVIAFCGTWLVLDLIVKTSSPVQQMRQEPVVQQPSAPLPPVQPQEKQEEALQEVPQEEVPQEEVTQEEVLQEEPVPEKSAKQLLVQHKIDEFCESHDGQWGICVKGLTDETVDAAGGTSDAMVSASVIKLFVMAAVYDRVEQGLLDHDQVYRKIYHMITVSDNYSTNELIRLLGGGDEVAGMAAVNDYAASIGCENTRLERLMLVENGLQNYVSAVDCAALLTMIYRGSCVSAEWSAEMLQILKEQTVRDRIPARLPADTVCANKTGDLAGLCCADVGIVFTRQGDYILCVLSDWPNNAAASIAELSAEIYEAMTVKEEPQE